MSQTAILLTEDVLPNVQYRQFVLTLPVELRYRVARDKKLLQRVLRIAQQRICDFYEEKVWLEDKIYDCDAGGVTFLQLFGSALNLNPPLAHHHDGRRVCGKRQDLPPNSRP